MAYARIRPRRGTSYEWSTYNPILESGELGLEYPDTGIGTGLCKFKVGDGSNHWNDLEYAFDGTAASSFDGGAVSNYRILKLRSGSSEAWANIDPILNKNELVYVIDKNMFKVGNGTDNWSSLPYCGGGGGMDDSFYDCGSEDPLDEIYSASNNNRFISGSIDTIKPEVVHHNEPVVEVPYGQVYDEPEETVGLESLLDDNKEVLEEKSEETPVDVPEEASDDVIDGEEVVEEPEVVSSEEEVLDIDGKEVVEEKK